LIGILLSGALAAAMTDSVMVRDSATAPVVATSGDPAAVGSKVSTDSVGFADSSRVLANDSLKEVRFATTVVKGVRRYKRDATVSPAVWTKPSGIGLPGPVESLREQQGVAFSSELSGHFSSTGMPVEGSAVTWNGAQILWPWHFGGLFGALDEWTTGSVRWSSLPGEPGPSRGGGWLDARDRAWSESDTVHAAARLGFVAGGAAVWGRRGDWGWQLTGRRTWLDAALDLANDQGWTDQEMKVLFQDGTAALNWRHGSWNASAGWFGSEDTLGIRFEPGEDGVMGLSWQNLSLPFSVGWTGERWSVETQAAWTRYRRFDQDLSTTDTLSLLQGGVLARRNLGCGRSIDFGTRIESWRSIHELEKWEGLRAWTGDTTRLITRPFVGFRQVSGNLDGRAWIGGLHAQHDAFAPEGGVTLDWRHGLWSMGFGAQRKVAVLSLLDQAQTQIDAASPAWVLPPGSAARTTSLEARFERTESDPSGIVDTRLSGLGWYRLQEGLWNWTLVENRAYGGRDRYETSRSDGWSTGAEIGGAIGVRNLELSCRQILSMDVLRDRPIDGFQVPSRWAPWDQRWRTEFQARQAWVGALRPARGTFHWESELSGKMSSGLPRNKVVGWSASNEYQDIDTTQFFGQVAVYGKVRTPYFRLDFTPIRMGREGRWSLWWTLVNVTNATNLMGWSNNGSDNPSEPVSQIPFLPVVFGVQVEI